MSNIKVEYSVIIPTLNSENTLEELYNRLKSTLNKISKSHEIIFIDDGSTDGNWNKLKNLREKDHKIKIIKLMRNFGQHNAIFCGFKYCEGNYIIIMDDDLQNPPEEIPKLINKIQNENLMVVYGKYPNKCHGLIQNFFSGRFRWLMSKILKIPNGIFISSFVVCRKEVINNALKTKTSYPFLTALIIKNTPINKIANIETLHCPRKSGKSNYNFLKWIRMSKNLVINYSSIPVKFVGLGGFFLSLVSIIYGMNIVVNYIINKNYGLVGWNSMMVFLSFLGGIILLSFAVIVEYLQRILLELSSGNPYMIEEYEI